MGSCWALSPRCDALRQIINHKWSVYKRDAVCVCVCVCSPPLTSFPASIPELVFGRNASRSRIRNCWTDSRSFLPPFLPLNFWYWRFLLLINKCDRAEVAHWQVQCDCPLYCWFPAGLSPVTVRDDGRLRSHQMNFPLSLSSKLKAGYNETLLFLVGAFTIKHTCK